MKILMVMTVLWGLLPPAAGAETAPKSAAALLSELDDIERKIKDLSDKEYGDVGNTTEPPTGPRAEEGYFGIELLDIKYGAFVAGGVGGFWGKTYDKHKGAHDSAFKDLRAATGKRSACEKQVKEASRKIDDLQPKVDALSTKLAEIAQRIKDERAKSSPNENRIWAFMDEEKKIHDELKPLNADLRQQKQQLASAKSQLPGLVSQEKSHQATSKATYDTLVKEESRLFLKWFNEE